MSDQSKMPVLAGNAVKPIVPDSMDAAWRLANAVVKAGMAPKGLDSPEACMVAMLHGLELGLTPMAAIQSIAVVNGRPQVWGDGLLAIVRASGRCKYIREWFAGDGDQYAAWCETHRDGEPEPVKKSFSIQDAKLARLWAKPGPWQQFPKRMLAARARSWCLRDTYADFLKGVGIADEMLPVPPKVPGRDRPTPPDPDMPTIDHQRDDPPVPDDDSTDRLLSELERQLGEAVDMALVEDAWIDLDVEARLTNEPEMLAIANSMRAAAQKRISRK